MDKNFLKIIIAAVVVLILILALPGAHVTAAPSGTPPPQITAPPLSPTPSGGNGGSGGSGGGGSVSSSGFDKYTELLKTSDGSVIGHLDGEGVNSIFVWAERNGTIGNNTYALTVEGELFSKPDNCWLNINFSEPGASGLPPGMENSLVFAVVNVTKSPDGWSWKSGSPKFTLKISGPTLNPGDTYYLVRSSGSDYQMQKVSVDASGSQATIKLNPPGDAGVFSIVVLVSPTPVPSPTPTPVPSPLPTPVPEDKWTWGFPIFIAMFAVGVIVGAAALFILTRNR